MNHMIVSPLYPQNAGKPFMEHFSCKMMRIHLWDWGVCFCYRWKALPKGRFLWDTGNSQVANFCLVLGFLQDAFKFQGYSPVNICWRTRSVMYTKYGSPVNICWGPTFICCGKSYFPARPYPHIHPISFTDEKWSLCSHVLRLSESL